MTPLTLLIFGLSLFAAAQGQTTSAAASSASTSQGLQLLTTVGLPTSSGTDTATVSGNSTNTSNSTSTSAVAASNNTAADTGINPSTAVPSIFPSNGAFSNSPLAPAYLITAAGLAGFAALGL